MPDKQKWGDAPEKQLLLEVIMTTNLTIPLATWPRIATAMGDGYTAEACRQKYQQIKRKVNGDADKTDTPKKASRTTTAAKPAKSPKSASKGQKRKANDDRHDDDEEAIFAPKSRKVKKEKGNGVGAEVFKVEEEGESVDLERDDLYDSVA